MRKTCLVLILLLAACAGAKKTPLSSYQDFAAARSRIVPTTVVEIYGRFTASSAGKSVKASFNLLLEPGKHAYLEILDPSQQQTHAFSLDAEKLTLLWSKQQEYVREDATPQNLQAITGFPVQADDLMLLMGGLGLNFPAWKEGASKKDGWTLVREPFTAQLALKEEISRIEIASTTAPAVRIEYSDYRMTNNRLVPRSILMSVPDRKITLRLQIDKFLPRDEPASADLFDVQLPAHARQLQLREIYNGKPLIY